MFLLLVFDGCLLRCGFHGVVAHLLLQEYFVFLVVCEVLWFETFLLFLSACSAVGSVTAGEQQTDNQETQIQSL